MTKNVEVLTRLQGDVSVIDIRGDVTAVAGAPIEEAYEGVTAAGATKILIVFAPECYINSGGIAVLIGILAQTKKRAQLVRMTGLTPHFQKIFAMVGLTKYAEICASEHAAVAAFSNERRGHD
jgi:anti-anti-sigma factor